MPLLAWPIRPHKQKFVLTLTFDPWSHFLHVTQCFDREEMSKLI